MLQKVSIIFLVFFFSKITEAQVVSDVHAGEERTDSISESTGSSNFYLSGQLFNASRTFQDLSSSNSFQSRLNEQPINTGGIEVGSYINLSERFYLSIGVNYYSGGETWSYSDSLTDSSFTYTNRYRQIGIPLRLNLTLGEKFKWFGFIGVLPSSILGRKYESSYTDINGASVENDVEIIHDHISSFQFAGSFGTGFGYSFGSATVFVTGEYRHHFTNTYTGLFLNHHMRLLGVNMGLSLLF